MQKNHRLPLLALSSALLLALSLPAQGTGAGLTLRKEVSGTVVLAGKPVANASVHVLGRRLPVDETLLPSSNPTQELVWKTNAQGQFAGQLPCWRFFSIYAALPGKGVSPIVEGITPPRQDLELTLAPAWNFEGKLVYRGRAPGEVIGMRLQRMSNEHHAVHLVVDGKCSEDGSFAFRDLPPGPWQLRLDGKKRRLSAPFTLTDPSKKYEIPLARAYTLTVRVATAGGMAGKNVAGARVRIIDSMQYHETTGDDEGLIVLPGLEKGPGATFLVEAPGFAKEIYALEPGLSPKDPAPQSFVQTEAGRRRKGRILDVMGNPVPGIVVVFAGIVHPSGVSVGDLSVSVKTDKNGRFSTDALDPEAAFDAKAIVPGGEPMKLGVVQPHRGSEDMGSFRLGSSRVQVKLTMQKGVQLTPDHKIAIYGPKESGEFTKSEPLVWTQGLEFRSPSLLPGEYVVYFTSKTLGISRRKVFIATGVRAKPTTTTQLIIARPKLIEGTLVNGLGEIVANRGVQLVGAGENPEGGTADWTNLVLETIRMDQQLDKKYPAKVKSDAKGKFKVWCLEASGQYDLLVTRKHPDEAPTGVPPLPPMRVSNILGRPLPIQIRIE